MLSQITVTISQIDIDGPLKISSDIIARDILKYASTKSYLFIKF